MPIARTTPTRTRRLSEPAKQKRAGRALILVFPRLDSPPPSRETQEEHFPSRCSSLSRGQERQPLQKHIQQDLRGANQDSRKQTQENTWSQGARAYPRVPPGVVAALSGDGTCHFCRSSPLSLSSGSAILLPCVVLTLHGLCPAQLDLQPATLRGSRKAGMWEAAAGHSDGVGSPLGQGQPAGPGKESWHPAEPL